MTPRAELRDHIQKIAARVAPGRKLLDQITIIARLCSQESGLEVGRGTVKDWWFSLDDDSRRVDSRHMDWARARSRILNANDNGLRRATGFPGGSNPPRSEMIGVAA